MNWYSDEVYLYTPSPQQCADVMSDLIKQLPNIKHNYIRLWSASAESTLVLVSQIHKTGIRRLLIYDTHLNEDHVYCISQCLINNQLKYLWIRNTELASNELVMLTNAIRTNNSLEKFDIWDETFAEEDVINNISELLTVNKKLQNLTLYNCGITDEGVKSLSSSLLHNSTLNVLDLRNNLFISYDGIQHLLELISTSNSTLELVIEKKHKSSVQQEFKKYDQIKYRLRFW